MFLKGVAIRFTSYSYFDMKVLMPSIWDITGSCLTNHVHLKVVAFPYTYYIHILLHLPEKLSTKCRLNIPVPYYGYSMGDIDKYSKSTLLEDTSHQFRSNPPGHAGLLRLPTLYSLPRAHGNAKQPWRRRGRLNPLNAFPHQQGKKKAILRDYQRILKGLMIRFQ